MKKPHNIRLQRLHQEAGDLAYRLTQVHFSHFGPQKHWCPALNAYLCGDLFMICVDLAGVEKDALQVRVESGRLVIRGYRPPPEPGRDCPHGVQVFAMEIDYGDFERELALPVEVDAERITAHHRNGLLWIKLPLRTHG